MRDPSPRRPSASRSRRSNLALGLTPLPLLLVLVGCAGDDGAAAAAHDIHAFAGGCYTLDASGSFLRASDDAGSYEFAAAHAQQAARFFMKASDLGSYLFYDEDGGYLVSDDGPLVRRTELSSDVLSVDDDFVSGAEWELQISTRESSLLQLHHRRTDKFLGMEGLVAESSATGVTLRKASGCRAYPELTLDAEGSAEQSTFDDGTLFGIVDTHSHILSNFGFGGGGVFHGAPFHRLGIEHALPDCETFHGSEGRQDLFGFGFDGADGMSVSDLLPTLLTGTLMEFNHHTAGYPEFTDWPSAPFSSTHQTQYYLWLQRAHLAGLRLVVQHATTNSVICDFMVGQGIQPTRYSCNDMVAVDRILKETRNMERYIDAQSGGPGKGWFRIVESPAEAREVIGSGKMAVVLGIETSNLFDCFSVARSDSPVCDEAYMRGQLDRYQELGVRALFPVHKYDNAFSAGDGSGDFIELGNFLNSGHWSSFTKECPDVPPRFDGGDVSFGGLNMPREEYMSEPPNDMSGFPTAPLLTAAPYLSALQEPPLKGAYCQSHGLTDLGERLLGEMMRRGMIVEIDHLPRRGYQRAFELLQEADYPPAATHGSHHGGRVYELGGVSKMNLNRCQKSGEDKAMIEPLLTRVARITKAGGYPAEGFGFDLNGFAHGPRPRFGPRSRCSNEQTDPVTYPFDSYAGDVTFTEPRLGNRKVDFNTEGFVHIGMLPELIQDTRADGATDEDLEPLFRSAEGYVRMWEKAETRAAALRDE